MVLWKEVKKEDFPIRILGISSRVIIIKRFFLGGKGHIFFHLGIGLEINFGFSNSWVLRQVWKFIWG